MDINDKNIGVVIVCYNTPYIITNAVESVISSVKEIVIIDYSDKDNDCYNECKKLNLNDKINVYHYDKNMGHGPGLNIGIDKLNTEYIICMDSDAILLDNSLIVDMVKELDNPKIYGCGKLRSATGLKNRYLYLPFCMFKKSTFKKYHPFIHDGAPFKKTMIQIKNKLDLVQIPNFDERLLHIGKSTRKIAGYWRKGFGGKDGI